MKMWLDDIRDPWKYGKGGWVWVKTAEDAVALLKSGDVEEASLDHDLSYEQMIKGGFEGKIYDDGEGTGYDVVCWLERNPQFWPKNGTSVHSMNPAGRQRMEQVIHKARAAPLRKSNLV